LKVCLPILKPCGYYYQTSLEAALISIIHQVVTDLLHQCQTASERRAGV
jgi:hypothetical protein